MTKYELMYRSTYAERYESEQNDQMEDLADSWPEVTLISSEGGTDGTMADNIIVVSGPQKAVRGLAQRMQHELRRRVDIDVR